MEERASVDSGRMYTTHGKKKLQGVWMKVNDVPSLTFTSGKGDEMEVVGYTTIDEIMKLAYSPDLPNVKI